MRDGREVVVKVQRPQIRESVLEDLTAMREVAQLLDQHTNAGKKYEFGKILDALQASVLRELDYRQEAQNLITLGENLTSSSGWRCRSR